MVWAFPEIPRNGYIVGWLDLDLDLDLPSAGWVAGTSHSCVVAVALCLAWGGLPGLAGCLLPFFSIYVNILLLAYLCY